MDELFTLMILFLVLFLFISMYYECRSHRYWLIYKREIDSLIRELDRKCHKVKFPDNNELIDNGEDNAIFK